MKLGGASTEEIALEVGLCERTVRRELAAMLKSLEV
jgi:DNA-binding NarL/FixJ family response regulator